MDIQWFVCMSLYGLYGYTMVMVFAPCLWMRDACGFKDIHWTTLEYWGIKSTTYPQCVQKNSIMDIYPEIDG